MVPKSAKAQVNPVRQRTQFTCMSTSMMMCLQALGHDVDEGLVNKVMGAQAMQGAAWEEALACAQHFGVRATLTMPATVRQLKSWTDAGKPIMIAWNPEGRDWSHASVVYHVSESLPDPIPADCVVRGGGHGGLWVWVADPNIPNPDKTTRIVHEDEFYSKWYEKWPRYLVRRPACMLDHEITPDGRQVVASRRPVTAEEHDCWKDYKGGGLTWDEYQDCLNRFRGEGRLPRYSDKARWFYTWASIARILGKNKDAEFIESVGGYVERKGYMTAKQGEAIERMRSRYRDELRDPKATLDRLEREKKERERAEAEARREELARVRALARFDASKWHIQGIEALSAGGDTIATFREDPYEALVFWFNRYDPKSVRAGYVKVEKDGKEILMERDVKGLTPDEAMEYAQGVIAADIQGIPYGKPPPGRPAPEPPPPAPAPESSPKERHTWDRKRTEAMIAILDTLIDKGGPKAGMLMGFKGDLERGKGLTEGQLKAIRHNLYQNRMRPEADQFRLAADTGSVAARYLARK